MDVYFKNNKNNTKAAVFFEQGMGAMALKEYLDQLGRDMKWEQPLEANDDGSYSLRLEPDIAIHLKEEGSAIAMQATLAPLPAGNTEDYLLRAMSANLFGNETGGAFLGLDGEGKKVMLLDILFQQPGYPAFHDRLEDFVNYADAWRSETIAFNEEQLRD